MSAGKLLPNQVMANMSAIDARAAIAQRELENVQRKIQKIEVDRKALIAQCPHSEHVDIPVRDVAEMKIRPHCAICGVDMREVS